MAVKAETDKEHDSCADSLTNEDSCALCSSNLDTEKGEASALHATVISQKYSNKKSQEISQQKTLEAKLDASSQEYSKLRSDGEMSPDPGGGKCDCARPGAGCSKTNRSIMVDQNWETAETLEQYLCYGCRVTLRDLVSKTFNTELVLSEVSSYMSSVNYITYTILLILVGEVVSHSIS